MTDCFLFYGFQQMQFDEALKCSEAANVSFMRKYRNNLLTLWCLVGIGDFRAKQPDRTWLCVRVALVQKAVESCSKAQKTWQVFWSALKKTFCLGGADILW